MPIATGWRIRKWQFRGAKVSLPEWTAELTTDLLRLIWILEGTLAESTAQQELLAQIAGGVVLTADDLGPVQDNPSYRFTLKKIENPATAARLYISRVQALHSATATPSPQLDRQPGNPETR